MVDIYSYQDTNDRLSSARDVTRPARTYLRDEDVTFGIHLNSKGVFSITAIIGDDCIDVAYYDTVEKRLSMNKDAEGVYA